MFRPAFSLRAVPCEVAAVGVTSNPQFMYCNWTMEGFPPNVNQIRFQAAAKGIGLSSINGDPLYFDANLESALLVALIKEIDYEITPTTC
jgi:hypothetical protein